MRPETRLDSAVFQLTPTRTRCDLVVIANGRKEKIASGLLNPFVAHLKVAQQQIAKGGYSITLEVDPEIDAPWFTRGTVERFVRFVSTPEVLERVTTIESEILQIEDAITGQGGDNLGLRSVEDYNEKLAECIGGSKTNYDLDGDKSLILYKPGIQPPPPVQNDNATQEENSKVQLLRVLETRKIVLRKEQAMAFARAVAAGFNIDNLGFLITFADRFGASRLMKACTQFTELWRRKHETGQWIEVEPEAMSARSEFPPFNASGIMFMGDNMKQNLETLSISNGDANGEDAAKADQRTAQHSGAPSEYLHGPYQSAYPPWAIHPPYPMQGMPYYPGVNPYYPPPYPPMDDPRYHHSERRVSRKHSSDSKDSETLDDGSGQSGSEIESSHGHKLHKKGKRSGKKKPSVVVIRNINVTSKKHGSSESESQTSSDVASEESDDSHTEYSKRKSKRSSSKKKESRKIILEPGDEYSRDEVAHRQDGDQGNWNVFQSFLLRTEEKTKDNDADLFATERGPPPARRKESRTTDDPLLLVERDSTDFNEGKTIGFNSAHGRIRSRKMLSGDELVISAEGRSFVDGDIKEIEAGGGGYRRGASEDFIVYGQEKPMDSGSYLDPLAEGQYKSPTLMEKNMHSVADESFMIPVRSNSQDNLGPESCTAIDIDVELPGTVKKTTDAKAGDQLFYEPDELMPEREYEDVTYGYDPAMDYDSQMQIQPAIMVEDANADDVSLGVEGEVKKLEKDKKLRLQECLDKKKDASARRLPSSKTRLTDAQKRAQNLRAYKADLQKAKKEQEEEQIKRLERLKQERQKRIAARSSTSNSISTPQQVKVKPSPKTSPSTYKSSKFSDAEPGSFSPLRKLPARTTAESDHQKTGKASKLSDSSTNAVSKSTSSLAAMKKEKNGRNELSSERLKKLAEPKSNALTDRPSNSKSASMDHSRRKSMPEDTQKKKISAIMQLDQRKSATLPELKVKSPRAPSISVKNKTIAREIRDGDPGGKSPPTLEVTDGKKADVEVSRISNSDDNVVVEKTVVILENEVVSTPPLILPPGRTSENETSSNDRTQKPSMELEYTAIRAPPSPAVLPEAENPTIHRHDDQGNYEVMTEHLKDETEELTLSAVEKPYQAPFARVTSLENDSATIHAYPHALPVESETPVHAESIRARVLDPVSTVSVEETPEANEKPRNKESKGFRKLLKFGRKSHTSGTMDSDASSVDGALAGDASRSFSLLSPFRRQKVIVL
uniref:COP1-interacting protein 7 n=1 Tax=Oryza meridionalis TaxID=40149 RepID=A0A0E0D0H9_9ORYZ